MVCRTSCRGGMVPPSPVDVVLFDTDLADGRNAAITTLPDIIIIFNVHEATIVSDGSWWYNCSTECKFKFVSSGTSSLSCGDKVSAHVMSIICQ